MKKIASIVAVTVAFAAVGAVISLCLGSVKDKIIKKIKTK